MKTTSKTVLLTTLLLLVSIVKADTLTKVEITNTDNTYQKRVYVGPEFFWSHFKGGINAKSSNCSYKRNVYYGGFRLGIEYLQPQSYYFNTDGVIALGSDHHHFVKEKRKNKAISHHIKKAFRGRRGHAWFNLEQRIGYTFASSLIPSCNISFYGAPGFHYEHVKHNKAQWWYLAAGVKSLQQFGENFHVGCDLKIMYSFGAHRDRTMILPTSLGNKSFWGYELGTPIVWVIGDRQKFDVQLKPYILKFNTSSNETIIGARAEFGFKF